MIRSSIIQSRSNPKIKEWKKLKERKHRLAEGKDLVEGFRLLEEAFRAGKSILCILLEEGKEEDFDRYVKPYLQDEEVLLVSHEALRELSSTVNPQGIVGVVSMGTDIRMPLGVTDEDTSLYVYLDGLQDPGNLGTILRSAHAAGARGILFGKNTVDPYGEKVLRSSMGSIFHIPLYFQGDTALEELVKRGFKVAVTSLLAKKSLFQEDLTGNIVVVIGNEGSGITREMEEKGDILLCIPMPGGAESLNASVAASIVLFERVRQLEFFRR